MAVVRPSAGVGLVVWVVEGDAGVTPGGAGAGKEDGAATALLELEGLAFFDI